MFLLRVHAVISVDLMMTEAPDHSKHSLNGTAVVQCDERDDRAEGLFSDDSSLSG